MLPSRAVVSTHYAGRRLSEFCREGMSSYTMKHKRELTTSTRQNTLSISTPSVGGGLAVHHSCR